MSVKRLLSRLAATTLLTGTAVATSPAASADTADLALGRPVVAPSNQAEATAAVRVSLPTSHDGGAFETAAGPRSAQGVVTVPLGETEGRFVEIAFTGAGALVVLEVYAASVSTRNLVAAVQSVSASTTNSPYSAPNAIDGDQATYSESAATGYRFEQATGNTSIVRRASRCTAGTTTCSGTCTSRTRWCTPASRSVPWTSASR